MKAISIGTRYEIYDDSLKAYDKLPAKTYTVRFGKMTGFYLEERSDLCVKEKVYGVHPEKAEKVLSAFAAFERNLGVILSGDKGIGKSLFARLLSAKAVEAGYPVIIIDEFIPGIASYIESIEQEAVFLFDEFDKTFGGIHPGENEADPQSRLLSLFDGTSQGKKLFIITCNSLYKLNDYLVNRPGRFHYHFRFDYPSPEEIRQYLLDKLAPEHQGEIEKVIAFSRKVTLNYDCLRAIAFELERGEQFDTAIQDLNIINTNTEQYNVAVYFKDGSRMTNRRYPLNLFSSDETETVEVYSEKGNTSVVVEFSASDCVYDATRRATVVPGDRIRLDVPEYHSKADKAAVEKLVPEYMTIIRAQDPGIHYKTV